MKKIISSLAVCAAAVNLTSCGGIGIWDYFQCLINPGDCTTEECVIGKTIDAAVNELMGNSVGNPEQALEIADTMDTLFKAVKAAEGLGIKVPSSAKESYNKVLTRVVKHNYFDSDQVRAAFSTAQYLD